MPLINNKPVDIVDVGTGNIANICSAFKKINISYKLCSKVSDFNGGKIILPGVGAYADFTDKLKKRSIDNYIVSKSNENVSILGICLGFQVLFTSSTEHKFSKGLNLLKGDFCLIESNLLTPHVGWNDCEIKKKNNLFIGIDNNSDFYFSHSYILKKYEEKDIIAFTEYGTKFPSAAQKNNIYGVQFHPEKSQDNGLLILKNFYEMC